MKKRPLVSVIMPVYNAGVFLVEAIESIRRQTVSDFELLIIDDASTDKSWNILTRYARKDKRIKVFSQSKNIGLVKSLNLLLPKTRGKYVARMDADDISLPTRFAKQIALLEAKPWVVACGGQEEIINERGRVIAEKYFPTDEDDCYRMIANAMVIQPPILMARGDVMRKLRYDNHIFKNDDISMHFKLLAKGAFFNVDEVIFQYRKREDSLTHRDPKRVFFLALMVRINAIRKAYYTPPVANILLLAVETLIVAMLPNPWITATFEFLRFTHDSARRVWRIGLSAPSAALAKAASLLAVPHL